jgi:hypothetical protein
MGSNESKTSTDSRCVDVNISQIDGTSLTIQHCTLRNQIKDLKRTVSRLKGIPVHIQQFYHVGCEKELPDQCALSELDNDAQSSKTNQNLAIEVQMILGDHNHSLLAAGVLLPTEPRYIVTLKGNVPCSELCQTEGHTLFSINFTTLEGWKDGGKIALSFHVRMATFAVINHYDKSWGSEQSCSNLHFQPGGTFHIRISVNPNTFQIAAASAKSDGLIPASFKQKLFNFAHRVCISEVAKVQLKLSSVISKLEVEDFKDALSMSIEVEDK